MERKPPVKISILEKDESEVSHCWKYGQIFSYIVIIISGIATTIAMGRIGTMFKHECLLYADLAVSTLNNWTIVVVPHTYSRWGSGTHCSFTQYTPVASVIVAVVWGAIFVMCGRGGASSKNLPQPWRIIPPAILFNFIFLVLSCVSVALTCGGFSAFCASIAPQLNVFSCEDLIGFSWERYPDAMNFYDDLVLAQTGSSFVLSGWLLGFVILIIRVVTHADFRVIGPDRKSSNISSSLSTTSPGPPVSSSSSSRSHSESISSSSSPTSSSSSSSGSPGSNSASKDHSSRRSPSEDHQLTTALLKGEGTQHLPPSSENSLRGVVVVGHHHPDKLKLSKSPPPPPSS